MTRWIITDKEFYNSLSASKGHTAGYRVKEIKSGKRLELEIYPYWDTRPQSGVKAHKLKESRTAQKNQNEKDSKKRFIRLLNTNFDKNDLHITLTFEKMPPIEEAVKHTKNYLAKINRRRKKAGLTPARYMYVTESACEKNVRTHVHLVIEGGLPRDEMESLWPHGYANADRLQLNDFGLEGLGRYLMKDPKGRRRWCSSKNLKQPEIKIYDHKIKRRTVQTIENNRDAAREVVKKLYPGYTLHDPEREVQVRTNNFVTGAYVTIMLTEERRT